MRRTDQHIDRQNGKRGQIMAALYIRLSREDGDKPESCSITNQKKLLQNYIKEREEFEIYDTYVDDGYSGTNFERPAFKKMLQDIEDKKIQCVICKDLSRLGRENITVSQYINDFFPSNKVRFIAVDDNVDKEYYDYNMENDMMLDIKNLFNGFYPKDISKKVRSTFRAKQKNGEFIGAFPSYGYRKSATNHNQLEIDEEAASVIQKIYSLYLDGVGQNTIAKILNDESIPCPSEYKKIKGLNYHNSNKLESTNYWTYSTIHRILTNEMLAGNMVQNKTYRRMCKKKAVNLPKEEWIRVENTHPAIIPQNQFIKVQELIHRSTKQTKLQQNIHMFAGFLKCGDCGRTMVKITRNGKNDFNCGSYNRYGKKFCSMHYINERQLEEIILSDLNKIIESIDNLQELITVEKAKAEKIRHNEQSTTDRLKTEMEKNSKKKERLYDDYLDGILNKEEYLRIKKQCEEKDSELRKKIEEIQSRKMDTNMFQNEWIQKLLEYRKIDHLDRSIIVEMVSSIEVYENQSIKIHYNFSDELAPLFDDTILVV